MDAANRLTPERLAEGALELVPGGPLAVALGGGADSSVAAWAVSSREAVRGIFVRHGLPDSPLLERAARSLAGSLGIGLETVEAPVGPGPSLEDRARRARWDAIGRAVGEGETVITGHTRDDQAETVLMNLLRGSGTAGLAGMARSRPGVARPLIGFGRNEIRSIAVELGLPFADDPSNQDPGHLRNRIRAGLLPMLDRDYRRGIVHVLARAGSLAAADDLTIEDLASGIPVIEDGGAVLIPAPALETVPVPVAARTVRRGLRRLLHPYAGSAADVDAVLRIAAKASGPATISGGLEVTREGPYVVIDSGTEESPAPVPIEIPALVSFGRTSVRFEFDDERPVRRRSVLLLDEALFGSEASLQCAAAGDRIEIDGGSKTVRTVLSEREIPPRLRPTWPVIVSSGRIAAIVGLRVAPWARPSTGRAVIVANERGRM